jgi:hypothetical protein
MLSFGKQCNIDLLVKSQRKTEPLCSSHLHKVRPDCLLLRIFVGAACLCCEGRNGPQAQSESYEVFVERLLFFLAVFFAFFAFFALLAMLPSVVPKSSLNASRASTCIHSQYTTIANLISRGSKMLNEVVTCDRTMHSRDAWTQRTLPDQDEKKFSYDGRNHDNEAEPSPGVRAHDWITQIGVTGWSKVQRSQEATARGCDHSAMVLAAARRRATGSAERTRVWQQVALQ